MSDKYAAGMIVLNEEKFIGDWLRVHYGMFDHIIIVEGADVYFPEASVSANGLSIDGTAEVIRSFPDPESKITFIQHGLSASRLGDVDLNSPLTLERPGYREGEGKCILRDRYAAVLNERGFNGILIQVDADEFYPAEIQQALKDVVSQVTEENSRPRTVVTYWTTDGYVEADDSSEVAKSAMAAADANGFIGGDELVPAKVVTEYPPGRIHGFRFPTIHLWKGMDKVIVGRYFDVEHTRVFRWKVGSRYEYRGRSSHNWPTSPEGKPLMKHGSHQRTRMFDIIPKDGFEVAEELSQVKGIAHQKPYCLHLGFTRSEADMRSRLDYYKRRGELVSRPDTVADREVWFGASETEMQARGIQVFDWLGHNPLESSHGERTGR